MKLRDAPINVRRFRFADAPVGRDDVYILVTPKCHPSPIQSSDGHDPRPALYVQVGRSKSRDEHCEQVLEFRTPRPEHLELFFYDFAEAETQEERERAAEIWERLVAWHGDRRQRRESKS